MWGFVVCLFLHFVCQSMIKTCRAIRPCTTWCCSSDNFVLWSSRVDPTKYVAYNYPARKLQSLQNISIISANSQKHVVPMSWSPQIQEVEIGLPLCTDEKEVTHKNNRILSLFCSLVWMTKDDQGPFPELQVIVWLLAITCLPVKHFEILRWKWPQHTIGITDTEQCKNQNNKWVM